MTSEPVVLKHGQRWEFVNDKFGTVVEYELESFETAAPFGQLATLRNIENDRQAHVLCKSLRTGTFGLNSHWRVVR